MLPGPKEERVLPGSEGQRRHKGKQANAVTEAGDRGTTNDNAHLGAVNKEIRGWVNRTSMVCGAADEPVRSRKNCGQYWVTYRLLKASKGRMALPAMFDRRSHKRNPCTDQQKRELTDNTNPMASRWRQLGTRAILQGVQPRMMNTCAFAKRRAGRARQADIRRA